MIYSLDPLPIAEWVEVGTRWLTETLASFFYYIQLSGDQLMDTLTAGLLWIPPAVFIIGLAILAYYLTHADLALPSFILCGLGFILNQNLWMDLMNTLTLVIVSSAVSILIGIPLGILSSKYDRLEQILKPILDFMQTMPAFVYLIPAVAFFGIGRVPGVFASVIFALPPTVRMTSLGIRQIPQELIEAAEAFGSTPWQKLSKVELPLARGTIMAGVNQTVMLALSMVVTGSMIGAPGLGRQVLSALQRTQVDSGFVAGLSIVILAIIIDRLSNLKPQQRKDGE